MIVFLLFLGGLAEVASIGAIVPFLAILINPQDALNIPFVSWIVQSLNFDLERSYFVEFLIIFSIIIVLANLIRFWLAYIMIKFKYELSHDLGLGIYENVLHESYNKHINRNNAEIIAAFNKLELFGWIIYASTNAISSLVLILFITITLIIISPFLTIFILILLGFTYLFFYFIFKNKLIKNSNIISLNSNKRIQEVQEGLGSIRDILLNSSQRLFLNSFGRVDIEMRNAQISNEIISPIPRYVIEVVCILFIIFYVYISTNDSVNATSVIPTIGILVVGLQRLIPLGQMVYNGWTKFNGEKKVFFDIINLINQKTQKDSLESKELLFKDLIEFRNVSFAYQNHLPYTLNNINFKIKKGARIAIIGPTGSGKSTVADLIMGLLQPSEGSILIDGKFLSKKYYKFWRNSIAHVPQDVYLVDASFTENIAFGVDVIDMERVIWASEKAQISDFINECKEGYKTFVGEKGVSLSGGQKQRIAIARALYKKSSILVFDEATSALDDNTEMSVVSSIESLGRDITTITIAHRLSTVAKCDWVYKLNNGILEAEGTPKEMLRLD